MPERSNGSGDPSQARRQLEEEIFQREKELLAGAKQILLVMSRGNQELTLIQLSKQRRSGNLQRTRGDRYVSSVRRRQRKAKTQKLANILLSYLQRS